MNERDWNEIVSSIRLGAGTFFGTGLVSLGICQAHPLVATIGLMTAGLISLWIVYESVKAVRKAKA